MRKFMAVLALGVGVSGPALAQSESRAAIAQRDRMLEEQSQQGQPYAAQPYQAQPYQAQPYSDQSADVPPASSSAPARRTAASGGDGSLVPQLLVQVQQMQEELRTLRGRVDDLANQQQTQTAALNKQISDLSFQLQQGAGAHAAAAPAPAVPAAARAPAPAAPRTPAVALQAGDAALQHRDYAAAAADAQEVLASPHAGPRVADAQYLLGQAESGQRNYKQAAIDYYGAYQKNPRGFRAPDSLVGVADSLLALNDKRSACQALAKLHAEYTTLRPGTRSAASAASARAGCR